MAPLKPLVGFKYKVFFNAFRPTIIEVSTFFQLLSCQLLIRGKKPWSLILVVFVVVHMTLLRFLLLNLLFIVANVMSS